MHQWTGIIALFERLHELPVTSQAYQQQKPHVITTQKNRHPGG